MVYLYIVFLLFITLRQCQGNAKGNASMFDAAVKSAEAYVTHV